MDSKRWDKLEALIEQSLALPAEDWDRFLSEACGSDAELRSEIESLLSCSDKALRFTRNFSENVILPTYFELGGQQERAESVGQPTIVNEVITHYQVIEKLGSGGMGVVYKARDLRLDRFVAIKLLSPHLTSDAAAKKRFVSEAKAVSALDHPNICTLHEISETDSDRLFMVMAWYKGETLREKIKQGSLPPRQTLHYALQIADGLACAHKAGFTHRDVKPANIMVTGEDVVKILDFGIARNSQRDLTREGTAIGSLPYMSPEQVRDLETDHRNDIWALGVVLYEMLTGKRPFEGETDVAVLHEILHNEPIPARDVQKEVPEVLEEIINKCLAKDPKLRYQHIDEVLADLKRVDMEVAAAIKTLTSGKSPISTLDTVNTQTGRRPDNKLRQTAMFVIPILFALSVLALFLHPQSAPVPEAQRTIAVLPFENLSPDPEDAYFADGVHEEIISSLSGIGALTVIARSSVRDYLPEERNLDRIGRELNVSTVMEGTVRRAGDRIRVSVNLIDAGDQAMIWSDTYEDHLHDVFGIQNRIAREVAGALQATLTAGEQQRLEEQPTDNMQAYHFYIQAREYLGRPRHQVQNPLAAEQLFKRALQEDSQFAHAWAMLALTYTYLYWHHGHTPERLEQMREAAEQAQRLAPDLAETKLALGLYHYWSDPDYEMTLSYFESALQQFPNHPELHHYTALTHRRLGNWDQVEKHYKRAIELDTRNSNHYLGLAFFYHFIRNYDQAVSVSDRVLEISPDVGASYYLLNAWYIMSRDGTFDGFETWREALQPSDPAEVAPFWWGYYYFYWLRNWDEALRSFNNIKTEVAWESERQYILRDFLIAKIHEYKDDGSTALEYYEKARLHLENLLEEQPDDPRYRTELGRVYARMGEPEKAIREGKRATELMPLTKSIVEGEWYERELAYIYTWSGRYEDAIDILELLLSIPSTDIHKNRLRMNPDWDPLREHPRFQALTAEAVEPI